MAESTTLDINHQDPQRPTGLSDFKEECRKGGGRTAFSGVILDHCHACPEPPLESVLAKQGKASRLEPLRGYGLWREARLQGPSPMMAEPSAGGPGVSTLPGCSHHRASIY